MNKKGVVAMSDKNDFTVKFNLDKEKEEKQET